MGYVTKGWLSSKTVLGVLTGLVPVASSLYDYALTLPIETISKPISIGISVLGAVLALAGRKTASKPLKGVF